MSVTFRIYGAQELVAHLRTVPAAVRAAVMAKMQGEASSLSEYIKEAKLSGQVLKAVSGRLRASIYGRVYPAQNRITLSVGSRGDVPYAGIHEYGGQTSAHTILPTKGRVLAFYMGGARRFAASVNHPGSTMPERSYLRSALAEKTAAMTISVTEAVVKAARG